MRADGYPWILRTTPRNAPSPHPARSIPGTGLPGADRRTHPARSAGPVELRPGGRGRRSPWAKWSWEQFRSLPETEIFTDIHCVTKWSKLDTTWKGVTIDDLLTAAGVSDPPPYLMAFSYGGYTTNLPTWDVLEGRGMVAFEFDGQPIAAEARRPGSPGSAAPVLLEVRQVAARHPVHAPRPAGLLGAVRLPHVRRPLEGTAVLGRLIILRRSCKRTACASANLGAFRL